MTETGLREQKKERTRRLIADSAARLFGEHGYDQVTVAEVARAADVSQQTVYNYFPTKRDLVLDRDAEIVERLTRLIRDRPAGVGPAAALRPAALAEVRRHRKLDPAAAFGDLAMLSATSDSVRRLALEARDRQSDAVAQAIHDTAGVRNLVVAKAQASALLAVFQWILDHAGRRRLDGASSRRIGDELERAVTAAFDDLETRYPE